MEALFLKLFNMSITAAWVVLVVVVLRLLLRKAPKSMICFLWLLVAIRLIFPISIESVVSLIPSTETITEESLYSDTPVIDSGINAVNDRVNPVISESLAPEAGDSVNPMQVIVYVASYVWVIGMVGMLIYAIVSYFRLWIKVREAVVDGERIWLCDRISTPFILGIIRPGIYIPSWVEKDDKEYVIAHERAHLKRKDHWWKPLGFFLLTVYWFNPVMWLAYVLLCKDIEYACDEKVIEDLGVECKKDYSNALVNCSVSRKSVAMCPLAFGEVGVKNRIKSVLSYKQPAFWVIIGTLVVCVTITAVFMTNPKPTRHYGRYITQEELYENLENCLLEYSISEVPLLDMDMINEEIRAVRFSINSTDEIVSSDYPEYLKNVVASAFMAYGCTQHEKLPWYVRMDEFRDVHAGSYITNAFESGEINTYYENISVKILLDYKGYKLTEDGLMTTDSDEHYINMFCVMKNMQPAYGVFYMQDEESDISKPVITLNEDKTFSLYRGTGEQGDIEGIYVLEQDRLILENNTDYEWYEFEVIDPNTLVFDKDRSDPLRYYYGTTVSYLDSETFILGEYKEIERQEVTGSVYYIGEDSYGNRPNDIVRQYYEYLEEEYDYKRSQWYTDEYLDMIENAEYQDMTLGDLTYCAIVDETNLRASDQAWIDEISEEYSCYCFVQTDALVVCEEDGPSGMKGETVNQQFYFALVLDPKDGRWKIDDFGYPGFEIPDIKGTENTTQVNTGDIFDITNDNFMYTYFIKDIDRNVLAEDTISRQPDISFVSDNVVKLSVQAGTGITTRWTIYYDIVSGTKSEVFYTVLGEYENNTIFIDCVDGKHYVVVRDIFEQSGYYKAVEIEGVETYAVVDSDYDYTITNDGKLKINYLKGTDLVKTELIVDLADE